MKKKRKKLLPKEKKNSKHKEKRKLFPIALIIVFVAFTINIGVYLYHSSNLDTAGFTGFSIRSIRELNFESVTMSFPVKIYLLAQWAAILAFMVIAFYKDKSVEGEKVAVVNVKSFRDPHNNRTDLDTFYEILKRNKKISLSVVAKTFKIDKELALEWSKILETGNLAKIEYPGFGETRVVLKEEWEADKKKGDKNKKEEMSEKEETVESKKEEEKSSFLSKFMAKKKLEEGEIKEEKPKTNEEKINNIKPIKKSKKKTAKLTEDDKADEVKKTSNLKNSKKHKKKK